RGLCLRLLLVYHLAAKESSAALLQCGNRRGTGGTGRKLTQWVVLGKVKMCFCHPNIGIWSCFFCAVLS
ncbi:MAG: hypothetical protein RR547_13640, partial [Raoultibacter sp.]